MAAKNEKHFYARRSSSRKMNNGKQGVIWMHRLILNVTDSKLFVDHIDHNSLNNCRSNLRLATNSQNQANSIIAYPKTSKYRGVSLIKRDNKWMSQIRKEGKIIKLGIFENEEEAAITYDKACFEIYGQFANLNFH